MCAAESALEFRRRRAVELMERGESKKLISRILGVSNTTLNVWLRKIRAGQSLVTKRSLGRPRRLNNEQLKKLEELLKKGATSHGWKNNLWTTGRIRVVIRKHFKVKFCRSGVWHVLHDYLHWSAIRPAHQAANRDEVEIARWKAEEFPRIERQAKERNAHLVFIDESGFMMMPTIRRTFAPCGSTPVNKVVDPHGRISVSGAIIITPSHNHVGFWYYMLADNLNFKSPNVIDMLRHLGNRITGPMTILWDQIIIHSSDLVLEYLEAVPHIRTEPFPPYAPELNPVDRAWFYIKYDRLPNYTPPTLGRLRRTVESELKRLQQKPKLLRSFLQHCELPFSGNLIA